MGLQTLLPEILRGFDDLKWASLIGGPIPQLLNVIAIGIAHFVWKDASFHQVAVISILSSFTSSAVFCDASRLAACSSMGRNRAF